MLVEKIYCKTKMCVAAVQKNSMPMSAFWKSYENECTACGCNANSKEHVTVKVMEPDPVKTRVCTWQRYSDQVVCHVCNMTFDAGDEITGCPNPDVFL